MVGIPNVYGSCFQQLSFMLRKAFVRPVIGLKVAYLYT